MGIHSSPIRTELPAQTPMPSYVDTAYTKAYVRHLFIADEILAMQIASIHNLAFYLWLVEEARRHIMAGHSGHALLPEHSSF